MNFGIIFSMWDWLAGTATMEGEGPASIGFEGVDAHPRDFFAQEAWPLQKLAPKIPPLVCSLIGAALLVGAWFVR